jgi:hypothetical protein
VSSLLVEIALRFAKALAAGILGLILWVICVGPLGAIGSPELGLLCWLAGAAFVLVVERSPL